MKRYKIMDKKSAFIDSDVVLGDNVVIGPNVILRGKTVIGENTVVDANSIITDSKIGKNNYITSSVIEANNSIGDNNKIGPFTHLREYNVILDFNEIGSYVEIKNSHIGNSNMIKHLSYVGNTTFGDKINIGAGVVFANYHPKTHVKEKCIVGDNASIGSNCVIVAPVKIGKNSVIGAGTTVRCDIDDDSLYMITDKEIYKKGYYGDKDDS